jgi:UDP-glucuronate 4-epimerase
MTHPNKRTLLLTGAAGFIGYHLTLRLIAEGYAVVGTDNIMPDDNLPFKTERLRLLEGIGGFEFRRLDLNDEAGMGRLFEEFAFDRIVHLAARTGVRPSLQNPMGYLDTNVRGTGILLDLARRHGVSHMIFASSSSVYGDSPEQPFSEGQSANRPISVYAATKKAGEMLAFSFAENYGLPLTGLRFFTVYGPWNRRDMAVFRFLEALRQHRPIVLFNQGLSLRDFTFVEDITEAIARLLAAPPPSGAPPFELFNIGYGQPRDLFSLVRILAEESGLEPQIRLEAAQAGDVESTWADTRSLEARIGFRPRHSLEEGLRKTVAWYRSWSDRD